MDTLEVHTGGQGDIFGVASGRVGDYSQASSFFVGVYQKADESFKRVSVYCMIDEENRWNAPHPRFTSSGGRSPEMLHHLRNIFFKHQKDKQMLVKFFDEDGSRLSLYLSLSGDITIGVESLERGFGVVVSFKENHALYQNLLEHQRLIKSENLKNPDRNPVHNLLVREHLKTVNLFP